MASVKTETHTVNGVALEVVRWLPETGEASLPALILLHEGLGSVSLWRDFPLLLADRLGCEVIAYSRAGYGQSDPVILPRSTRYMHDEAFDVLPQLIKSLGVPRPVLLGHSDGGSIALICSGGTDVELAGMIVMAPHIKVEKITVDSIAKAKIAWQETDLPERLGKHHADVDSAFKGWNDIWLEPEFLQWNIECFLSKIKVPVLAVQGEDDEYGSMTQIDGIKSQAPQTKLLKLEKCRHSPHKDQTAAVLDAIEQFYIEPKIR